MQKYYTVEECCYILDSKRVPITASKRKAGIYPYYGANGVQDYIDDYIFDGKYVLLAEDGGNFGSKDKPIAYIATGKFWVNNHAHVLKPKDFIDTDYLCYSLAFYDTKNIVNGTTRQKLTQAEMRKMKVTNLPLSEQKRIADELDKVCSAIEKQKKQLALCDEIIKSKFNEIFGNPVINDKGWDVKSLNEICDVRDGTHDSPKYVSEGYPLITSKNVSSGFLDFSQVNLISKEDYDNINKRSKVDLGDILMPMIGTIGKPIIVNIKPFFAIKNMALIKFSKTNIINIYIFSLLSSEFLKIKANDQMKGGTQKFMSLGTIRALKIPIPPLPLQQQFADFVNEVEESKLKIKESLNKTETLYKALMQKYFEKGE